jgi:hypothetical protein
LKKGDSILSHAKFLTDTEIYKIKNINIIKYKYVYSERREKMNIIKIAGIIIILIMVLSGVASFIIMGTGII